jgi:catechol-2,3-dioxygenase
VYHLQYCFRRANWQAVKRLFALRYRSYPTTTCRHLLDDPEGNGIELYAESPEDGAWSMANGRFETRRADGTLSDGREPLDVEALFSHLKEDDRLDQPAPPETRLGHVHLHVRDVDEAVDFYHGVLGFDDGCGESFGRPTSRREATYISLNTWQEAHRRRRQMRWLRYFTVERRIRRSCKGAWTGQRADRRNVDGGLMVRPSEEQGDVRVA